MLKDKYTFEHNTNTVFHLHASLKASFLTFVERKRITWKDSPAALAFLCLRPFVDRIENKSVGDKKKLRVSIKKTEALSLHMLYRDGFLDTNNYLIKEMFTAIDKTICTHTNTIVQA